MLCPNCFTEIGSSVCPNCNYNTQKQNHVPKALPYFTVLNSRYQIGRVLGKGGFGITYVAKDLYTNEIVAVKECVPDAYVSRQGQYLVPKENSSMEFDECIRCFKNEKNTLKILSGIPGVVGFIDEFSENNTAYFVMEFVEGVTLKRLTMKNGGTIPLGSCMYIFLLVGSILTSIHSSGVIHRDISPENIMISSSGDIVIIDFGAAKNRHSSYVDKTTFLKHGFAPPEQYEINGNHGEWTDVYALAATFYTVVSGQPLIDAQVRKDRDTMKSLYELDCGLPKDLSDSIDKALSLSIYDRYMSISNFFEDMGKYSVYAEDGIDDSLMEIVNMYHISEVRKTNTGRSVYSSELTPYVQILTGLSADNKIKIPEYGFISLGKDPAVVDFALSDSNGISRRHCIVGYDRSKNRFIVIDRSTNGTLFSNGVRMIIDAETYLAPDDEFCILNESIRLKVILE